MQTASTILSTITGDSLLANHLRVTFKNKDGEESDLTILEKALNHSETTGSSTLFIKYLEKLRFEKSEYAKISIKNPLVYKSNADEENEKMIYFRSQTTKQIIISPEEKSQQERSVETAESLGSTVSMTIGVTTTISISWLALFGSVSSSLVYLVKFFNVLESISSLGNLNVNFGSNIEVVLTFIESIKIPTIGFLAKISPIKDSEPESADSSAYQTVTRGSRAKMTQSNDQIFITSGQNFVISLFIVLSWVLMVVFEQTLGSKNTLLKSTSFIFRNMIGLMFFDYQAICVAEIAFFDYKRVGKIEAKFKYSLFLSILILFLIVSEILSSVIIIPHQIKMKTNGTKKRKEKIIESQNPSNQIIFEKYTEVINLDQSKHQQYHLLIVIGDVRFFMFQVVVVSLQHLNRSQSLLVVLINLAYFIYFVRALMVVKVFKSKAFTIKQLIQEICIMVFLSTITLFSFTENTKFSDSVIYKWIEYITIASIIGACGAEFVTLVAELGGQLFSSLNLKCIQNLKKRENRIKEITKQHEDKKMLDFCEVEHEIQNKKNELEIQNGLPSNLVISRKNKLFSGKEYIERKKEEKETRGVLGRPENQISIFDKNHKNDQNQRKTNISVKQKASRWRFNEVGKRI